MSAGFSLEPVAFVRTARQTPEDDAWGDEVATLVLGERFGYDALAGLEAFSHLEVVFLFHQVDATTVTTGARHPRGNPDWPSVGIFAQRAKDRPNRIGVSRCALLEVRGREIDVEGLDAIDGTPVLDIKPWFDEMGPRGLVVQSGWSHELMADYW